MPQLARIELDKEIDIGALEARCRELWESTGIYRFSSEGQAPVFSIDTPPPYVSAAHLHVGHAMSYSQAEFVVRYHRMTGKRIFYPMGFDDNGLPTERYVEKTYNIDKRKITRSEFRALCLQETKKGAAQYEELWRSLGLSVDWRLRYSTIDDHCQRTAQLSFIDLYRKGHIYRSQEPVLWDPQLETSLAQADLESMQRKSQLHDVAFSSPDGTQLVISTTRPELLPACVALYCNPTDERYRKLIGSQAVVPLFGHTVPVMADEDVLKDFGTGLMMVCTFGDGEDVRRWKRDGLATRLAIGTDGRLTEIAGEFKGLSLEQGRQKMVAALTQAGALLGSRQIEQIVSISERSGAAVEFTMVPQWFVRVLDLKDEMRRRSGELRWFPAWMKVRLDDWIEGLKFDWNISRQRFYGVPVPVWFCEACGTPLLAKEEMLPVDPVETMPPAGTACTKCNGSAFRGDADVMDTWMTSSLSPLINADWAGTKNRIGDMSIYPMSVRVQAFEIIRTWLFYTIVKSHLHTNSLPWHDVMISGWGLNEGGKKISKRDLEKFTDAEGFNRYDPYSVLRKYGADALRYWAAGSQLGNDLRYNENDVKVGRKLVLKLWNAARYCLMQLEGFDPQAQTVPVEARSIEDRWLLLHLNNTIKVATEGFENYNYAIARETTDRFFWDRFCDDYLEMVKDLFWNRDRYPASARASAQTTMWEVFRGILALYAPFVPFVTEDLYQRIYRPVEGAVSVHIAGWPKPSSENDREVPEMTLLSAVLRTVRALRTEHRISQTRPIQGLILDTQDPDLMNQIRSLENSIQAVARVKEIRFGPATAKTGVEGLLLDLSI
jgi:valyl-tRNA synthetase